MDFSLPIRAPHLGQYPEFSGILVPHFPQKCVGSFDIGGRSVAIPD